MSNIVTDYEAWLRSWGASESTVRTRCKIARGRLAEWGGPAGFTVENVQAWLGRPDLAKWTRSTYNTHLRELCKWLVAAGHLAADPMEDVRRPGRPSSLPRPLSEAEVARVLKVARGRQRTWIILGLHAGLRAHEIARIRGEHVTAEGIYVQGKGGKREHLPIHPDIWAEAQRYPHHGWWFESARVPGSPILPDTVTNYTSKLFLELGIAGSIHRCRHTYGTRLLRAGVNIRKVQKLMRHSSLETTATYTAVDEDELRAAVALLPSAPVIEEDDS